MTLVSRVFGFIRDMLTARLFGAGLGYDAFLIAFKIPNFTRRLFAEGAFSQAFVPVLSEYTANKDKAEVKELIDNVAGALSVCLLILVGFGVLLSPYIIQLFAPGFIEDGARYALAVRMLRITFVYAMLISLVSLAGSILNVHNKFVIPALTPVLLNIAMITAALCWAELFDYAVVSLAYGVVFGGVLQLLLQLPQLLSLGLLPRLKFGFKHPGVLKIRSLMLPAILGSSVVQINLMIDSIFASFLPIGSISWLYYSDRVLEFPLGVFGIALVTVITPKLAKCFAKHNEREFTQVMDFALRLTLIIGLPASVGLFMLAKPITVTLFYYGKFALTDVVQTAWSLQVFAFGLLAFILVKIFAAAFYARQDTKEPVKVALYAVGINVLLNLLLYKYFFHRGVAAATCISALVNALMLLRRLIKQGTYSFAPGWLLYLLRLVVANCLLVIGLYYWSGEPSLWYNASMLVRIWTLLQIILSSMAGYGIILWLLGIKFSEFVQE